MGEHGLVITKTRYVLSAKPVHNREQKDMSVLKISDKGLCVIGVLVAVLWGMVVANHLILRSARTEAMRTMRRIKSLQMQDHSRYSSRPPRPHANITGELPLTSPTSSGVDTEHQMGLRL
jgi:hypothetical protein